MKEPDERHDSDNLDIPSFVAHLGRHYSSICEYVTVLVARPADADDIVQETCITLWKKFSTYDPNRDFCHWARGIAFVEVLRYRRALSKNKLFLSERVLEMLSDDASELEANDEVYAENRRSALANCLRKLPRRDQEIIQSRYENAQSVRDISSTLGRPESTIYKMLIRIRAALSDCVVARMSQESHPHE